MTGTLLIYILLYFPPVCLESWCSTASSGPPFPSSSPPLLLKYDMVRSATMGGAGERTRREHILYNHASPPLGGCIIPSKCIRCVYVYI